MSSCSPFGRPTGAAAFFKPADHMTDLALLVEPKSIKKDVPHTYQGRETRRDEVIADVSVFANQGDLDKAAPSKVLKGVKVVHGMLTGELEAFLGKPFLGVVRKVPTKSGSGYAFREADADAEAAVAKYYEQREAAVKAAIEDAPGFD